MRGRINAVHITYIGHSTTLIESGGTAILTDPIFSNNIFFLKRKTPLNFDPSRLPKLTAILISHLHLDHFDIQSFNYIPTDIPIIMPEGAQKTVGKYLPNPIIELSEWAQHEQTDDLKIRAVPVTHSGFRYCPCHGGTALGYVIEVAGKTILFAGDTAYNTKFKDIGNTCSIDLALLPIACYKPAFFMKRFHMDPVEAVQAFLDSGAKKMIPIHWGTFSLSLENLSEPIEWLKKVTVERGLQDRIIILNHGESVEM